MSEILDLDSLLPKPIRIKISGKVVDLFPGKLKMLVRIQDMATSLLADGNNPDIGKISEIIDALSELIPALKTDKTLDISPVQITRIIEIAYQSLTVTDSPELNSSNMGATVDKKKEGQI